jgi:chromosome segregation ATPase
MTFRDSKVREAKDATEAAKKARAETIKLKSELGLTQEYLSFSLCRELGRATGDVDRLRGELEEKIQELREREQELARVLEKQTKMDEDFKEVSTKASESTRAQGEQERLMANKQRMIDGLEEQLRDQTKLANSLRLELKQTEGKLMATERSATQAQARSKALEDQLNAASDDKRSAEAQLKTELQRAETAAAETADAKQDNMELHHEIAKLRNEIRDCQEREKIHEAENDDMQNLLNKLQEQQLKLTTKYQQTLATLFDDNAATFTSAIRSFEFPTLSASSVLEWFERLYSLFTLLHDELDVSCFFFDLNRIIGSRP